LAVKIEPRPFLWLRMTLPMATVVVRYRLSLERS
jgi:hypothetical protein